LRSRTFVLAFEGVTTHPQPPPEAELITELREQPPRMSMREAAALAEISESRWRQIEHGVRYFRGEPYPENGPPATVAKMMRAIGIGHSYSTESWRSIVQRLDDIGCHDAAGELEALIAAVESDPRLTGRQKRRLTERIRRDASDE
jgi:hypothetical protein